MNITVRYSTIDGFHQQRRFKTLAGARAYAHKWLGSTPELGQTYAVSGDGVGKITTNMPLTILFPEVQS